jgi:hypothetical protein
MRRTFDDRRAHCGRIEYGGLTDLIAGRDGAAV